MSSRFYDALDSYSKRVRSLTLSKDAITARRNSKFIEVVATPSEQETAYQMLGVSREAVAQGLRQAFDADDQGEEIRDSLLKVAERLQQISSVGTPQAQHFYRILFKDSGTFLRMHQGDMKLNFPFAKGMPRELIIEPIVPEIDSRHSLFKQCLTELIQAGIVLGPTDQGGPPYDGVFVGMMAETLGSKKLADVLRVRYRQNAIAFTKGLPSGPPYPQPPSPPSPPLAPLAACTSGDWPV